MTRFQLTGNFAGQLIGIMDAEGRVWNPSSKAFETSVAGPGPEPGNGSPVVGSAFADSRIPLVPHPHPQYSTVYRVTFPEMAPPPNGADYAGHLFLPGANAPYDSFAIGQGENVGSQKLTVVNFF